MKLAKFFLVFLLISKVAWAKDVDGRKIVIVASINPIHQIILAITQDKSNNVLIFNPASSEHDYNFKKTDAKAVKNADLIFYISADLEKKFPQLIASQNKNSQAFELIKLTNLKLLQQRNNKEKIDPHIWLDPKNALKIAQFISQKASTIDPKNAYFYRKNLAKFEKKISAVEKTINAQTLKIRAKNYVIYHDGYQYFEKYFDLKALQVMNYDHDRELIIHDLKRFDNLAKTGQIKCLFGEAYDEKNSALKLAQNYKIKFQTLDLIGQNGDYFDILLKISATMSDCLK